MGSISSITNNDLEVQIKFKYSPWLFIIDSCVRIIILYFYLQSVINTWIFVAIQISILIGEAIISHYRTNKLQIEYSKFLNPKYHSPKPTITIEDNVPESIVAGLALVGFVFSFWFFYHIFENHAWYMYLAIFVLSCFGMILFIFVPLATSRHYKYDGIQQIAVFSKKNVVNKNVSNIVSSDVTKNYTDILFLEKLSGAEDLIELDTVDYNDTRIAKLESDLKNITHRSEAWMLESVFLGGLAFSGFLTVASANFLGKETEVFKTFVSHLEEYWMQCKISNPLTFINEIPLKFDRADLYILIMLLCLMSSVFFLLVLTLRLRLNSLALNMDYLIRILSIFNSKEEELFNMKFEITAEEFQTRRLEKIQKKIDITLRDADKLFKELHPTSVMMNIYRSVAVLLFYLVLIISGFYFMPIIAFLIFSLAFLTQVYRLSETYWKLNGIKNLLKKH